MRTLISQGIKVQTCVTSPPYWGLRDYGVEGQLGQEPTIEEYVGNMIDVFGLVMEMLKDDGTLWLNIGDSYAGSWGAMSHDLDGKAKRTGNNERPPQSFNQPGLKPKDLCGIPWRVAFALQSQGWYLRSDIIWSKPNPMPESVTDRPTKSHEYLFLLTNNERYYYDQEAIKEESLSIEYDYRPSALIRGREFDYQSKEKVLRTKGGMGCFGSLTGKNNDSVKSHSNNTGKAWEPSETRNKRSVWNVATTPYSEAHFATFPPKLIEPCILAGSRPGDVVFDPFLGSGTTAMVAQNLGRKWIGIELNKNYEKLQKKRVAQLGMEFSP